MITDPAAKKCLQDIQRDITRHRQKCRKPYIDKIFASPEDNIKFGGIYTRSARKVISEFLEMMLLLLVNLNIASHFRLLLYLEFLNNAFFAKWSQLCALTVLR